MPRWLRIVLIALLAVVLLGAAGWWHLTRPEAPPERSDYVLDLDAVRAAAAAEGGERPQAVRSALLAEAALPRAAIFAGESFDPHPMVHQVFQIVFPDDGFGLVDAGFDQAFFEQGMQGSFRPGVRERIQDALARAQWIVITHEHGDHLQGLAAFPSPEDLLGRLVLTRPQLGSDRWLDDVDFPAVLREQVEPVPGDRLHALAPGVVLIPAAGHTPGSQIVYVGLADGRELLLIGDVAWHMDQIRELHYRPRLVTDLYLGEDREAVLHQFRALHDLLEAQPAVTIVPSHDRQQRRALVASGLLREDLTRGPTPESSP